MRQDAWRAYLEMALGVTEASRKRAIKVAKKLVGKSELTAEQLQGLADELVRASTANREALAGLVRAELDRALGAVGLAKAEEVTALTARIRELEQRLRERPAVEPVDAEVVESADAAAASARRESAEVRAAAAADAPDVADSSAVPASLASPPAKKAVAKKTVAKKTVAKKAVAKKAAVGKKTAVGKPVATAAAAPAKRTAKKTTGGRAGSGEPTP